MGSPGSHRLLIPCCRCHSQVFACAAMLASYAYVRIVHFVVSNLAAAITLILRAYASVAASILDLAVTTIAVRPNSSEPKP